MAVAQVAPATRRGMPMLGVIAVALVVISLIVGIIVAITVPTEEHFSVGVANFTTPPFLSSIPWFTRAMLLGLVAFALALSFWLAMSRNHKLVPGKRQYFGEWAYSFVRDGIARDQIGRDFQKYLPYLIALITFVIINNLWGMFPLTLFPTMSHVGWAYSLAVISWLIYNVVGIRKHGFFGYVKHSVLPAGVPPALWVLVIPIEFISNILIRPVTLSLRLFGNMFAGHLLMLVFAGGGQFLLFETAPVINKFAGGFALIFSLAILALETFVQCVQAYIMTILSAQYIGSALAEEH
ncbi:ATP synthase subunit a [Microlunatus endophyticus]|uniref:ATP synthase subunit a n=1 Tax=Microlunatus endophyticus TaxID=1716077 RepID=A0A917W2L3_9ACTN|nr:F0F1 ATP synthase subunit A [Microlunatus endophyticus]GGL55498.1 ATP synthase subunit a [Microlunatus endophyticus]